MRPSWWRPEQRRGEDRALNAAPAGKALLNVHSVRLMYTRTAPVTVWVKLHAGDGRLPGLTCPLLLRAEL